MAYVHAFSSLGWPEASLDEILALAARHRITTVELRSLGGTVDLPGWSPPVAAIYPRHPPTPAVTPAW
jgi:hypothetical protein